MAHLGKTADGSPVLIDEWHVEDIQGVCPDLTVDECEQVMIFLASSHDANTGINWEVIEAAASSVFPDKTFDDNDEDEVEDSNG